MELDEDFKRLVHELGQAINNALAGSDDVAEAMARIRSAGYDLFLVLELTIGFNKRGGEGIDQRKLASERLTPLEFNFTSEDTQFLRSLKIAIDRGK